MTKLEEAVSEMSEVVRIARDGLVWRMAWRMTLQDDGAPTCEVRARMDDADVALAAHVSVRDASFSRERLREACVDAITAEIDRFAEMVIATAKTIEQARKDPTP